MKNKLGWMLVSTIATACTPAGTRGERSPEEPAHKLLWRIPTSLEGERADYVREVSLGLNEVTRFFGSSGFTVHPEELIDTVVVFDSPSTARDRLAKESGAQPEQIPETFAGTVIGGTLFLVSRELYMSIWKRVYPDWPWTDHTYHQLIVHELAHRAHESIALSRFGSSEAMGPPWFFEGLAVVCARQFESGEPPMTREEIQRLATADSQPRLTYPLYGRLVRSLARRFDIRELIARASEPGFPDTLWEPPPPSSRRSTLPPGRGS